MNIGTETVLNMIPGGVMPIVCVNQYDTGYQRRFRLYNGAYPFNIADNQSVTIRGTKGDGHGIVNSVQSTVGSNVVSVTITKQMTAVKGAKNIYELRVVDNNGLVIGTANFILAVERAALDDDTNISDSDLSYADEVYNRLQSVEAFQNQLDNVEAQLQGDPYQMPYIKGDDSGLAWQHLLFTPEMYGAYGDGVHDDSTAIQNMIDSVPLNSVCVFLKTYLCNTGILVTRNVNLIMYGKCIFPGTLEYAFRVYGQGARRCKFRLNLVCNVGAQTVWQSHNIIGLDLWASTENEYDVEIESFKTGIRLFAGNTNSEVDCTYNKIFIRRIYNCQYAIFLTGGSSGGTMNSGTVAQNTFIGGRIGVQGASYAWLGAEDTPDNSYWAVRSVLNANRTNNNNTFLACSFEGFGVQADPYADRARVSADMQSGMYLSCRYEGMTSIKQYVGGYVPTMFLGGYALNTVLPENTPYTHLGRRAQITTYNEPVVLRRGGSGDDYLELRSPNNSLISAFYGNVFYIPAVLLTPDGNPYASGNISRGMKLILAYKYDKPTDVINHIEPGECKFSNYGHIIYKEYGGVKIHEIQPIYTTTPTSVNPGTMAFVNGRPRWYDGTKWVYADGSTAS